MSMRNNFWFKLNRFLEKRARIKSYGQKVVLILILLFVATSAVVNVIFTIINIKEEKENVKKALQKTVVIKEEILLKTLKEIEDNGKIILSQYRKTEIEPDYTTFKRYKIYGIYLKNDGIFLGRVVSPLKKNTKNKYVLKDRFIVINVANSFYIYASKSAIKDILDPKKSFISNYEPLFILEHSIKKYQSFICYPQKVKSSNFYIVGCVENSQILRSVVLSSIIKNATVFSAFFLLAMLLYSFIFKKVLLYPVYRLKEDIERMNQKGLANVRFELHNFGEDEFAQISKVLEDTRLKILKHQMGMSLVLQTTSKMISMTNDIHRFSLFTVDRLDELLQAEGTVLCLFSKIDNKCVFKVHSDRYLSGTVPISHESEEFSKLSKIREKNRITLSQRESIYIVSIKREVNEEYSIFLLSFKREEKPSEEDINYIDMIVSHLVYSINLLNLATYDPLTKLYNRRAIVQFAEKEVERSKRYHHSFSIILIDIDDFKAINDTYGHTIGDIVLKKIADILKEEVRDVDKIGRYGGEEFIIVLPETNIQNAVKLAERIKRKISEYHFEINNYALTLTISAGVAGFPEHGETFERILQASDLALYEAKKRGKNQVVVLEKEEIAKIQREEFQSKNFLDRAIKEDRIIPYFQPIVNLDSMEIVGYEVLARIEEDDTIISAYQFISTSIKFGIVLKIDEIIQRKTVEFLCKRGETPQMLFFNLSRPYIQDPQHLMNLVELLEKNNIPKESIVLEITEEEAISEITVVKEAIRIAKSKGIRFALDDFGVGYSTFSYIKHFDIDIIKLDGSLVKNIDKDRDNQIIVGGISYICKEKGIKLLAEMIETKEELETLKKLGVSYGQGFYFGKATENMIRKIHKEG